MKTFVDNVSVQVIEASIVNNLPDVFNPLAVAQMTSELVSQIAAESQENQTQRERLEKKIHILEEGLKTCKWHAGRYASGTSYSICARIFLIRNYLRSYS